MFIISIFFILLAIIFSISLMSNYNYLYIFAIILFVLLAVSFLKLLYKSKGFKNDLNLEKIEIDKFNKEIKNVFKIVVILSIIGIIIDPLFLEKIYFGFAIILSLIIIKRKRGLLKQITV